MRGLDVGCSSRDGASSVRYRYRVGALLFLLAVITYLDRVCISVAGPRIQEYLHIGPQQWGWVVGVFAIAYGVFEIPGGWMGDRFGPRITLTRIVLWWSAFTALTGLISSYPLLLVTRFCFGAGEAGAFPNCSVAISRWFPALERGRAFGVLSMAMQTGGALSPLLVVPIQARYGWRASFHIFALLGVAWAVVWFLWFRNSPAEKQGVPRSELSEVEAEAAPSGHGLPWGIAVHSGNFWAIMAMGLCYGYGYYFFVAWLHTFLVRARGFSEGDLLFSTLPFLCAACSNLAGGVTSDYLLKRFGLKAARRTVGMIGFGSAAVFTVIAACTSGKPSALVFLSLGCSGLAFNQPMIFPVCIDVAKKSTGSMTGAVNAITQLGAFLTAVAFGYLVQVSGSYNLPLYVMALVFGFGALTWLKIDPTQELAPEEQPELANTQCPSRA
jgi:MFS transporter, ACS family, glucarate transporter